MNLFVAVSTLLFFFLAFVWKKNDFINIFLKIIFSVMTIFGIALILHVIAPVYL